ncbi:hypothetical protein Ae201684P_005635 [Aphanomyces euteiches]|uniref:Ribophorin II n=1 Tax=Aphanomyces euteiches TaxID=100861 RepID=A0A6G0X150_9STRA|nr:hypothetical protein Ae201684_009767 [Aphanomyces euteiches]KAH9085939.1 hypothetical protein Ae201684P_005635 [Aphanomyces euteiches]
MSCRWMLGLLLLVALVAAAIELENPVNRGDQDVRFFITGAAKPVLKTLKNGDLKVIASDVALAPEKDGKHSFTLEAEKAIPGLYIIHVEDGETSKAMHTSLTTSVAFGRVVIQGEDVEPKHINIAPLASGELFSIEVSLKNLSGKRSYVSHQAFLHFTYEETHKDTTFALAPSTDKTSMRAAIPIDGHTFSYLSGRYALHLIVGDIIFENALEWNIGTVMLTLEAPPSESPLPLYTKPLLHESDVALAALPEITHVMRPPPSRPLKFVSFVFTALVIAPLLGFIGFVFLRGVKLSKFPSGLGAVWSIAFLATIAATIGLFTLYWLQLTMFSTLYYLAGLAPLTFLCGHYALRSLVVVKSKVD